VSGPIRTLVVGVGTRGRHWVRLAHEEPLAVPVGYVDPRSEALAWVQERYDEPVERCFSTLMAALQATSPELVILATPPIGRLEDVQAIFEAGCDLLAEKPLTLDFAETVEIVRTAEEAGRRLMVGLNFRYLPTTVRAKELMRDELGRPSFARFIYWRHRDGRRPGINKYPLAMRQPMLYEQSIHHLDLFRFSYDAEVERLWCRCHNPPWSMYRDDATVAATLEMRAAGDDRTLLVNYFGTWMGRSQVNEFEWRTDCELGALLQLEQFSKLHIAYPGDLQPRPIELPEVEPFVDDTRALLADVCRQLRAGIVRPHPSGLDHLKTMALTTACEESSTSGRPVEMAGFYRRHGVPQRWLP
jgi:predicted dehydrogenase